MPYIPYCRDREMAMNPRLMRPLAKTPPGTPASLLLRFNGADESTDFIDSSPSNLTVTANGNAQISTAQSKWGGASGRFVSSGDYVEIENDASLFPNGSSATFTLECWARPDATQNIGDVGSQTAGGLVSARVTSVFAPYELMIRLDLGLRLLVYDGSSWGAVLDSDTVLSAGVWHHIAIVSESGNLTLFIDGVADDNIQNTAVTWDNGGADKLYIGSGGDAAFNGYIDDLRLTPGLAVYDGDFVVPSSQSSASVVPYTTYKPYGTFLFSECVSGDLVGTYADGVGGRYTEVISAGSC